MVGGSWGSWVLGLYAWRMTEPGSDAVLSSWSTTNRGDHMSYVDELHELRCAASDLLLQMDSDSVYFGPNSARAADRLQKILAKPRVAEPQLEEPTMSTKRDKKLAAAITAQHAARQVRMASVPPGVPGPEPIEPTPTELTDRERAINCAADLIARADGLAMQIDSAVEQLDEKFARMEGMLKVINANVARIGKMLDAVAEPETPSLIHKP